MRSIFLLLLIVGPAAFAQTSQPVWQAQDGGQLVLHPFEHAPYPHPSREHGWKYQTTTFAKEGHYDDATVGIYIPRNYQPARTVDYVVHFHGWGNHTSNVLTQFDLPKQLNAAGVNAILIVPQGPKDASDSGGGKLELDPGAFAKLIAEVTEFLRAQGKIESSTIGNIVLTAHSGGYKVTAAVLDHGGMPDQVHDVLLLDASYGSLPQFVAWAKASPEHRLISTYTDHLEKTNQEFIDLLKTAGVTPLVLDEATLSNADLQRRAAIFFHTVGPHNQVPITYFGRFVTTCGLSKVSPSENRQ